jgi:hypothetical protein
MGRWAQGAVGGAGDLVDGNLALCVHARVLRSLAGQLVTTMRWVNFKCMCWYVCGFVLQEAHNLEEFAAAHKYLGFVNTPTVIWELTTTRCASAST